MNKIKVFIMGIICLLLPGCYSNNIDYYASRKNKVDLRSFFHGDIEGWGALFDYKGQQTRSFYVKIKGSWNGDQGLLEEWFEFDDGEKTKRNWEINFSKDNIFVGTAHDILGNANGTQSGNAINIHYTLQVPYKGSTINLKMDDWMYLVNDEVIVNRTVMKKFGFKVGEITLFMKKKS